MMRIGRASLPANLLSGNRFRACAMSYKLSFFLHNLLYILCFQHFPHISPTFFPRTYPILLLLTSHPTLPTKEQVQHLVPFMLSAANRYVHYLLVHYLLKEEKKMPKTIKFLVDFTAAEDDGEHRPGHG